MRPSPNPVLKKLGLADGDRAVILHTDDIWGLTYYRRFLQAMCVNCFRPCCLCQSFHQHRRAT
ncbi:MAG: hypothetical protein M1140_00755 [Chloroflexi bacterium]|nr:hypothetical protein [Chloroflexota bacterium]